MTNRGNEFIFFLNIRVRIDIRIDISIPIGPMINKFGKQVHLQDLTQMELIKQALVTPLRQDHLRNYNHYISITRVPMATKLGKMITYLDRLLLIKSHDPLISWSCKITLQNKTTISPLSERLWLPNLAGWYRSYLDGPVPIKSRHPLITWSCEIT